MNSLRSYLCFLPALFLAACNTTNQPVSPEAGGEAGKEVSSFSQASHYTHPKPLVKIVPVFPEGLRAQCIQGGAEVAFVVDEEGLVRNATILFATDKLFADAVMDVIREWTFEPATADGKPIKCVVRQPVPFLLRDRDVPRPFYTEENGVFRQAGTIVVDDSYTSPVLLTPTSGVLYSESVSKPKGVWVTYELGVDGSPKNFAKIDKSKENYVYDEIAQNEVKSWRFKPARKGNIPIVENMVTFLYVVPK